jgi:hypothetical protein
LHFIDGERILGLMEGEYKSSTEPGGARFFDCKKRDLGWATRVSLRKPSLGCLTVLDVTASEPGLAQSLLSLDHERLLVKRGDAVLGDWDFAWASGYMNGREIRIQGVLVHTFRPATPV